LDWFGGFDDVIGKSELGGADLDDDKERPAGGNEPTDRNNDPSDSRNVLNDNDNDNDDDDADPGGKDLRDEDEA
jgi:hypothetical protein